MKKLKHLHGLMLSSSLILAVLNPLGTLYAAEAKKEITQVSPPAAATPTVTLPRPQTVVTPQEGGALPAPASPSANPKLREIASINFNNVAMIEYIRFMSRISGKNFIFNDQDLQFNVTIISEESTSVENLMTVLLQELRIRDLSLIEQSNNILIHRNPQVRSPARIVEEGTEVDRSHISELATRVFRLNTLDPIKASEIIRPLVSDQALVEVLRDTNNLIITDLVVNINKVAQLIAALDAPNSGVTIGQYIVRNAFVDTLVDLATRILQPIAQGNPFTLVPHAANNSVYVVANAFIVEKALAILQNLDLHDNQTKIFSLENLQLQELPPPPPRVEVPQTEEHPPAPPPPPPPPPPPLLPPLEENREFIPGGISTHPRWMRELPVGHIDRTLFFLYKLRYRRGDQIEIAMRKIAYSLQMMGTASPDLVSAINSSQWIESSNAIIFTGTAAALDKIRELILEVDVPLRQVYIEMLILDTTIADSLTYGVDWINRFGGGSVTGEQGFIGQRPLFTDIDNDINTPLDLVDNIEQVFVDDLEQPGPFPVIRGILDMAGYTAGIIGTHLTHGGTRFSSIGALIRAVHNNSKAKIVLNPKIITEDNSPADIFVGSVDRYKTQSITNDLGTLVTNNFQFIDVGTSLRVTPLIGNNNIITLDIIQESTEEAPGANGTVQNPAVFDVNLVEVLRKIRTVTKVHVPNGFFVIISGMLRDNEERSSSRIPCLGGIPILGAFGKRENHFDSKRNLMLFIRPLIIDSEADIEDITKRQQDIYMEKNKFRRDLNYEIDEALNFLEIKPTDPDEIGCDER